MKYLAIRFQLLLVSGLLFATFALVMGIVIRNNYRWDSTSEKIYSIAEETTVLLEKLQNDEIEVLAFYPHDDPARTHFEVFMRQCQLHHRKFRYSFYDPDRVPSLAKKYGVTKYYTVVLQYQGRRESLAAPSEESFSNALLRLSNPKKFSLCFVTGHGEISARETGREGMSLFSASLQSMNYDIHDIILMRDKVPDSCHIVIVPGPHQDFDQLEFKILKEAFFSGKGILFMIDPMDPGTGKAFLDFFQEFGVLMGNDVIVDKMSRVVGGDFLVPLVNQYVTAHSITARFDKPTFYPVSRSLQPSDEPAAGFDVVPLAFTGNESWAETNLPALEDGDASFEPASGDLQGPLPVAAAVEYTPPVELSLAGAEETGAEKKKPEISGRMVVVGDSDFLNNTYVGLSGNNEFALNLIQWLSRDERFISIHIRQPEFNPLFLTTNQRTLMLLINIGAFPLVIFLLGGAILWRRKAA